jgi:signal transduction histidine kinase
VTHEARSGLEARVMFRLAPVIALALAMVAVVAIVATSRGLAAAETSRARALATTALRSFTEELGEQEAPAGSVALAAREVYDELDGDEVHVEVEPSPADVARLGPLGTEGIAAEDRPFGIFTELAAGTCTKVAHDGSDFRACAAMTAERRAVVALRIDDDELVVRRLALGMLVTFVLAVLSAFYAARRALHEPLDDVAQLAAWSERLAAGVTAAGDPPPSPGHTRETAQLSASIGSLVSTLVETLSRERASSAHIAHEMRTPLTALRAEIDELAALGPEAAAVTERLTADVDRLTQVIDAVLVLSSPRRAGHGETINVADLARSLARTHAPVDVEVDAPEEALVDGDGALIRLALVNLLDNAARHAAPGARRLRVERVERAEPTAGAVRLSVIDAGPGLDPQVRARAFERYWRAADAGLTDPRDPRGHGSGLGLALVRAVAEQHDGEADVRSVEGGPGLDIGFTLRPLLAWHS